MASTDALSLPDLAELTGLSPRTIRSLISQDLLRGPTTRGRYATYGAYHVERLRAIRYLREAEGLTVPETASHLERLAAEEVRDLAARWERGVREASGVPVAPASRSALDYLRSIGAAAGPAEAVGGKPRPTVLPRPREALTRPPTAHREALRPVERLVQALGAAVGEARVPSKVRGEGWFRIPITPNVELHLRGYEDPAQLAAFERVAELLRQVLLGGGPDHERE